MARGRSPPASPLPIFMLSISICYIKANLLRCARDIESRATMHQDDHICAWISGCCQVRAFAQNTPPRRSLALG
ncbi:hypothetical protein IG631_09542 [Alternaria alternata]|nr:hypothetical protein IG631_09542 [Alternaria alternata]